MTRAAMSAITRQDLTTILLFGIHIAKIDDNFDVWEKRILKRFADRMHLSDAERAELLHQEISLGRELRNLSSKDALTLLVKTLCAVSYVDGKANDEELQFIERVVSASGEPVMLMPREEWGVYEEEVFHTLDEVA